MKRCLLLCFNVVKVIVIAVMVVVIVPVIVMVVIKFEVKESMVKVVKESG